MKMSHEIDPNAVRALVELGLQLKNIKVTIDLQIKPESLIQLEEIIKKTIFWRG